MSKVNAAINFWSQFSDVHIENRQSELNVGVECWRGMWNLNVGIDYLNLMVDESRCRISEVEGDCRSRMFEMSIEVECRS